MTNVDPAPAPGDSLVAISPGFSRQVTLPSADDPVPWRAAAGAANQRAADHAARVLRQVLGDAATELLEPGVAPDVPCLVSFPIDWWNRAGMAARILRSLEMQALPESDRDKLRLVQHGAFQSVDPDRYTVRGAHSEYASVRPDGAAIAALIDTGAVANLNYLEDNDVLVRRIVEFVRRLSRSPVAANAYISRAGASGSGAHWDGHDVLLVQLMGGKHWVIGEPTDPFPIKGIGLNERSDRLVEEVTLQPGDALLLPRGYWHEGTSVGALSIHVTIAINRPRLTTVAAYWLSTLNGTPDHRRDVRIGDSLPESIRFGATAADVASFWAGLAATEQCSTSNRVDLVSNLLDRSEWTDLGLAVRLPVPGGFAVRDGDHGVAVLACGGRELTCSPAVAAVVAAIGAGGSLSIDQLVQTYGPAMDVHRLLRDLLVGGLLDVYLGDEPDWPLVEGGGGR
jgi:hypothetical protein